MKSNVCLFGFCLASMFPLAVGSPVAADIVTYDVDLSGTDSVSNHVLRVAGTISAETSTNTITGDTMQFFHNGVAQIGFGGFNTSGSGFAWNATLSELRFERTSNDTGSFTWSEPGPPLYFLQFGSGAFGHGLVYDPDGQGNTFDSVTLLPAGGPSSQGFLVGTTGVPEPSSMAVLSLVGVAVVGFYRRRKRGTPVSVAAHFTSSLPVSAFD